MIDYTNLEQYRENNRIEAKKALGGLPHSIWETYSAFANTLGGVILLGVEEYSDKSLHPIDLPDPVGMAQEFWDKVNNPRYASVNILSDGDVDLHTVEGRHIIAITVPRAERFDRPVYVDRNPLSGTYRRNGEGDYRCTREEVYSMLRDAAVRTADMKVLSDIDLSVFDSDTILRYRTHMGDQRPGHIWEDLPETEFLYKIGAVGRAKDGSLHPTGAGLLMFGCEYEIVREFPAYFLDYREALDEVGSWSNRLVSTSGDWSGNLYDFFCRVYRRISRDIQVPFLPAGSSTDDTPIHRALREALVNSIINADYYGRQGLVVTKSLDRITISNPGGFRIGIEAAKHGGVSDPRNAGLIKMFNLVNVSQRAGNGILNIYSVWREQGWVLPTIQESFAPDRITLSLSIKKRGRGRVTDKTISQKAAILEYLTDHVSANRTQLARLLGVREARANKLLVQMINSGTLVAEGQGASRIYKLRSEAIQS